MLENVVNTFEVQEYKLCPSDFDSILNNMNDNSPSISLMSILDL